MKRLLTAATALAALAISAACTNPSAGISGGPDGPTSNEKALNAAFTPEEKSYTARDTRFASKIAEVHADESKDSGVLYEVQRVSFEVKFGSGDQSKITIDSQAAAGMLSGRLTALDAESSVSLRKALHGAVSAKGACLDPACNRISLLMYFWPASGTAGTSSQPQLAGYIFKSGPKGRALEAGIGPAAALTH